MTKPKSRHEPKAPAHNTATDTTLAVDQFMKQLDHPAKVEIEAIRKLFLSVSPKVAEGIKWNAPSFRTTEYFATTNLRSKKGIGVILHLGAKVRALPAGGVTITDPKGLLKWLGKDRAMIEFKDMSELKAASTALKAVLKQWLGYV